MEVKRAIIYVSNDKRFFAKCDKLYAVELIGDVATSKGLEYYWKARGEADIKNLTCYSNDVADDYVII